VHPDLETLTTEKDPSIQSGKGVRAFVDSYAEWLSAWETFHATPIELHDLGDRVLAVVRMGGRTKTHGAEVEQWSAVIFEVADGLVRAVKFFTTAEDARREAGLVG
jgi:ketosteroid isomerase-like protein